MYLVTGIIQPRVGINLEESQKTFFAEIFAGYGGVDSYTNAISDIYQDNFDEGIYTGKGIYDLKVFCEVLDGKVPENTVLSHDLLEGSYLRCGLSSDIMLLDGFPKNYLSYLTRLERWARGDFQVAKWIKAKDLNKLSKFKIIDNVRRNFLSISILLNILFLFICQSFGYTKVGNLVWISLLSVVISSIIEVFNYIIFKKENVKRQRQFSKKIDGILASIYRGIIEVMVIPTMGYILIKAFCKTWYRMNISKKHLLEWTTHEEAEEKSKNDLMTIIQTMSANLVVFLIIFIVLGFTNFKAGSGLFFWLGVLFLMAPFVIQIISEEKKDTNSFDKLSDDEKDYIKEVAKKTWDYFAEYMNKENSYLPPDNFQESRREKIIGRTSATNIGLGLLAILSSYDLKFIDFEKALSYLENVLNTIQSLDKWNGHLYNWYNIKTLEPLSPRYISTVDSRKFCADICLL